MTAVPPDVGELRRLEAAATPGEWSLDSHSHLEAGCRCMSCYGPTTVWQTSNGFDCDDVPKIEDDMAADSGERCERSGYTYADAALIAALRNSARWLLGQAEAVERVRKLAEFDTFEVAGEASVRFADVLAALEGDPDAND